MKVSNSTEKYKGSLLTSCIVHRPTLSLHKQGIYFPFVSQSPSWGSFLWAFASNLCAAPLLSSKKPSRFSKGALSLSPPTWWIISCTIQISLSSCGFVEVWLDYLRSPIRKEGLHLKLQRWDAVSAHRVVSDSYNFKPCCNDCTNWSKHHFSTLPKLSATLVFFFFFPLELVLSFFCEYCFGGMNN